MKKIALVISLLLIVLLVCSCGANTVNGACRKADRMLEKWSEEGFAGCTYEGEYEKIEGDYYYSVQARLSPDANSGGYISVVSALATRDIKDTVYNELTEVFDKVDVPVIIIVTDSTGRAHAGILDGEITWFD